MRIAIITAGGAGMFCGSCMHDNTWAKALRGQGVDVALLPTYTPIRVDESNQSESQVFLGGVNLYMDHQFGLWKRAPRFLRRWLDNPRFLKFVTRFGVSNNAAKLGDLTLAMLSGEHGPQREGIEQLTEYLVTHHQPDVIVFSNALLVGVVRHLRSRFDGPIHCVLQGDDIFLNALPDQYRDPAIAQICERSADFDGFLTHSEYYAGYMADYLGLSIEKFSKIPLGIDLEGHDGEPTACPPDRFTIGYFARLCPEKGLQHLLPAVRLLHRTHSKVRLRIGGYLEKRNRTWFRSLMSEYDDLAPIIDHVGSPDSHAGKVAFLKSLDVLSVPTEYHEPKGLYVLEALANGIPAVQPEHGAFPELLSMTGGGLLSEPNSAPSLAGRLEEFLLDDDLRLRHARTGRQKVREHYGTTPMAVRSLDVFRQSLTSRRATLTSPAATSSTDVPQPTPSVPQD